MRPPALPPRRRRASAELALDRLVQPTRTSRESTEAPPPSRAQPRARSSPSSARRCFAAWTARMRRRSTRGSPPPPTPPPSPSTRRAAWRRRVSRVAPSIPPRCGASTPSSPSYPSRHPVRHPGRHPSRHPAFAWRRGCLSPGRRSRTRASRRRASRPRPSPRSSSPRSAPNPPADADPGADTGADTGADAPTRTGFLTMDQTRRLVPLEETDPRARELPVVGVWVEGAGSVLHVSAWAACLRFARAENFRDKATQRGGFLLAVYRPGGREGPECFDARLEEPSVSTNPDRRNPDSTTRRRDEFAVREDGVEPSVRAGRHRPRTIPNPRRRRGAPRGEPRRRRKGRDARRRARPVRRRGSISSGIVGFGEIVGEIVGDIVGVRAFSRAVAFHRHRVARIRAAGDATKPRIRALFGFRASNVVRTAPSPPPPLARRPPPPRSPRRVIVRRPDAWTATVSTAPRATSCGSNSA